LQVGAVDVVGQPCFALGAAFALVRGGGAQGGVEGDVVDLVPGRARLDVASALAVGARATAPPGAAARQAVQRGVEFTRRELLGRLDLFAALPPVGIALVEDDLR
jgi:hypothetical protein